ncbi:MAG: hypothetical protein FWF23_02115 [Alphaproteobacteria bacterium]|nr:hypothetical protein [Alphaproteobacteria bacterium]MCL2504734.1 hypothetical protein [Alphaproteobacteria bacterium]
MLKHKIKSNSGIAIGPILFVIFILAAIASAIAASSGSFSSVAGADKISNELAFQANLIRNMIANCKMRWELGKRGGAVRVGQLCPNPLGGGYPVFLDKIDDPDDSDSDADNIYVKDLMCSPLAQIIINEHGECGVISASELEEMDIKGSASVESIWRNERSHISVPLPIKGFHPWRYVNALDTNGGVCFWTAPLKPNPNNEALADGIMRAARKFRYSFSVEEGIDNKSGVVLSDPLAENSPQRFIVWLVPPDEKEHVDAGCDPYYTRENYDESEY